MNDQLPTPQDSIKSGMSRRSKILLTASLSLNALVIMALLGAFFAPDDHRKRPPRVKDISGNALVGALPQDQRKALHDRLSEKLKEGDRPNLRDIRRLNVELISAMRADPFDSASVGEVMESIDSARNRQAAIGREVFLEHISEMSAADRLVLADALEEKFKRKSRKPGKTP
ncbi:MAG: periplasmic heavy metal sensor [Pseudoruegeria sp.]